MSDKRISLVAANFDDALRVMEMLVPTVGMDDVSISPSLSSDRWFVNIVDKGFGIAELVRKGEQA